MELIIVLRLLWRRRLFVLLGAVLAVGAAFALGPSPSPPRGFALASVLLDTSRSQLVTESPDGVDTLSWRATLAGQLLGTDASRESIAGKTGIDPRQLTLTDLELAFPIVPASLPRAAVQTAYSTVTPYALNVHTDGIVPMISIAAQAPDRASAARLAESAVRTLQANTASTTSEQNIGLTTELTGPIDSVEIPGGEGRKKMAAVAVVLFGLWVAGMALIPSLLRAARTIARGGDSAPA